MQSTTSAKTSAATGAARGAGLVAPQLPSEFVQALRELGLLEPGEVPAGVPLAGGVSSDIWRLDT
ncbi:MAG: hypothetical protein U1F25_21065, partial [Rubrivivax sp.]